MNLTPDERVRLRDDARLTNAIVFLSQQPADCIGRCPEYGHAYRDEMCASLAGFRADLNAALPRILQQLDEQAEEVRRLSEALKELRVALRTPEKGSGICLMESSPIIKQIDAALTPGATT